MNSILIALFTSMMFLNSNGVLLAADISQGDQRIMNKLAQGSSAEVELGKLVMRKANNPAVKDFAQRMVKDHSSLLQQTKKWASDNDVKLLTTPSQDERQELNKLSSLTGKDLDHEYIKGMLEDHKTDVSAVASYIVSHPESSVRSTLEKTLPILENHLRIAENVAGKIGVGPEQGLTSAHIDKRG